MARLLARASRLESSPTFRRWPLRHNLGASASKRDLLLFGGGSAGARGAMVHLDYVPQMIGSASANVDVIGVLDSPLWMMADGYSNSLSMTTIEAQLAFRPEHTGRDCAAVYAPRDEIWKCFFAEYRLGRQVLTLSPTHIQAQIQAQA